MTLYSFRDFMNNLIVENLHPELQAIASAQTSNVSKQSQIAKKIKDLTARGETTGIEGNMPKGSSRAYLKHVEPVRTEIDGQPGSFQSGTKVAITSPLDKFHDKSMFDGLSLGRMQNRIENNDHYVNQKYRVLTKRDNGGYITNDEHGIFPPLVDHDHQHHEWTQVGHSRDIKPGEFRALTKTSTHPNGISHREFNDALIREYDRDNGRYWEKGDIHENKLDHIATHPLVEKFLYHQRETGTPPHDYQQKKNMGVFEHPNGQKFIVARDHGFDGDVSAAYKRARLRKWQPGY